MTILHAHYDGERIVLDEPMPGDIPPNTRVQVVVDETPAKSSASSALDQIASMAIPMDLPSDFSLNHKHYIKGTPKR